MATNYGVMSTGFVRPRLPEIKAELESSLATAFGVPINTRADSVLGQLIGVWSDREADIWEALEAAYYAMYPHTADGTSLDNSVAFTGVQRIASERTALIATCYGANNTTLPFGVRIKSGSDSDLAFSSTAVGYISASAASYSEIGVGTVASGATYTITIDGTTYSYTAGPSDTATSILVALAALMTAVEATVSVANGVMTIENTDQRTGFSLSVSTNLAIAKVGSPVPFACDNYGALTPTIGDVNQIVTQVAGWTAVANKTAATVGRDAETDITLRQRYGRSVYRKGQALVEAIQARLYEDVSGVTAAIVFENKTDSTDADGRPPHSIEAVVQGGDDGDIAAMLWQTKPPGIDTYGSTAVAIKDSQGVSHTMSFNRPTVKKIWVKVVLTKNPDESFAGDTPSIVQSQILSSGNAHAVGQDVILQKFLGNIYGNTIGIGLVTITAVVSDTAPAAEAYSAANIVIGARELATFSADRIEVTVV